MRPTRRDLIAGIIAAPLAAASGRTQPVLALTPECRDDDEPTPAQTAGPFYTPGAPMKRDFAADVTEGEPMTLAGLVLDTSCRPQPGAVVELWHCDAAGVYDNAGFRLRGHQRADPEGRWMFETVVPGLYPGRTRHFHLRAQREGGPVLTTQFYFPDEPGNARDGLFDPRLVLAVDAAARFGRYDLVLA